MDRPAVTLIDLLRELGLSGVEQVLGGSFSVSTPILGDAPRASNELRTAAVQLVTPPQAPAPQGDERNDPPDASLALRRGWIELRDGTRGYLMKRPDQCFQAAVATCLQVPMDEVPDWRLDARSRAGECPDEIARDGWKELSRWLDARGLRIVTHRQMFPRMRRWIGVTDADPNYAFSRHSLVMSGAEILHSGDNFLTDPRSNVRYHWKPSDVAYGFSFQSRKDR
jgi:hypothetical protein